MIFHVVLECGHKFLSFVTSHAFADRQTDRKALQYRALHYTCSRAVKTNTTSSLRLEWSDMNEIRGLWIQKDCETITDCRWADGINCVFRIVLCHWTMVLTHCCRTTVCFTFIRNMT